MDKTLHLLGSHRFLKFLSILTLLIYIVLLAFYISSEFWFHNNDDYKGVFIRFLDLGYYDAVSEGTTILYNVFLKVIYLVANNAESSFIFLNAISQLFIIGFGYYVLKKHVQKIDMYFIVMFGLYALFTINLKSFLGASNDAFLGVFVIIMLYLLVHGLFKSKNQYLTFAFVGIVLAVCFSIRMTAILMVPVVIFSFLTWYLNSNEKPTDKILKLLIPVLPFLLVLGMFHYPSLIEGKRLSKYDKNPKEYVSNWTQRNYLGLKKIEQGKDELNRDAIWYRTKFKEVDEYLKNNGEDSLPDNFFEVLKRDPKLVFKIFAYNLIFSVVRFFRFWGFLFFLLILPLFNIKNLRQSIFGIENLPSNLFLIYMLTLTFVCFTFIEFRWYIGYEILIPMAVLSLLQRHTFFQKDNHKNILFSISLICISLFNIRSIINLM